MKSIFAICLIIGFIFNHAYADEVPLPQFQEAVAAYVEDTVNKATTTAHLYEKYEKGFVKSKEKAILAALKKDSKKMEVPKVTREGRVLTFQVQNQKVTLEIVDVINQVFVINGRKVDLLKFATITEKHQYLFRLFNLKKTSSLDKSIFYTLFFGKSAQAQSTTNTVGTSVAGSAAGAGVGALICTFTAAVCIPAVATWVIIGTAVAGAYNVCKTWQMIDMCTKNEVIVGSTVGQIGQELEKLTDGNLVSVEISCSKSTIKVVKADTPERVYSDSGSTIIKALKRGCSADKKQFARTMTDYSDKRNQLLAQQDPTTKNEIKVNVTR